MLNAIYARIKQKYRTMPFPVKDIVLPERFLGRPYIFPQNCRQDCGKCKQVCPTAAIIGWGQNLSLDLGKCIFCGECQKACEKKAIVFTRQYQLAVCQKEELIISGTEKSKNRCLGLPRKSIFQKSLKLRQVSAGGCNACEQDINVLNTVGFDLGRFGIQFVASPRHADGIVVTGPVTKNMLVALEKTYKAVPAPKLVIAVGACAISGGIYCDHRETSNGLDSIIPVDLYVPGCPPHPLTILDGLLKIMR
jgi:Ni,Fe-hydrogenase III small subunit/NAD-dependent dihydropyrimidine dehydrogenase PreA subunit